MKDLAHIFGSIGLFLGEWLLIILIYILGFYELTAFRAVFLDISTWNLPTPFRSLSMILWGAIPIIVIGVGVNKFVLKLPIKLFWIIQSAFILSVWISLSFLIHFG